MTGRSPMTSRSKTTRRSPLTGRLPRARLAVAVGGAAFGLVCAGALVASPSQAAPAPTAPALVPFTVTFFKGVLTIDGDAARNAMVIGKNPAGKVTLNGAVVLSGALQVAAADVTLVQLDGGAGDDILRFDPAAGQMPSGEFFGGEGNDILDGGPSDDRLAGGPGIDTLNGRGGTDQVFGDAGNDRANGGQGDDVIQLGDDSDQFTWNPGDGSDVVFGGAGKDTLVFNGSNVGEQVTFSRAGTGVLLRRNVGAVQLFLDGFELLKTDLAGGSDVTTIDDLTGTAVGVLQLNHSNGQSDTGFDTVIVNGTSNADKVRVFGPTGTSAVTTVGGLATTLQISGADGLTVQGLAGDDIIDAGGRPMGSVALTESGGDDDDIVVGSPGNDILLGGSGDDRLEGRGGTDVLDGGPGVNVIIP